MNLSKELLDYLDKQFPNQSPNLNDKEREVWFKSGQASVVKHLKQLLDEQNKKEAKGFCIPREISYRCNRNDETNMRINK